MNNQAQTRQILWNESFSVGNKTLDRHHQHLAQLINQLGLMEAKDVQSEELVDVLSALVKYAEYHFDHEEKLMEQVDYHELESHRREHVHFCEVVAEICFGATIGIVSTHELFSYLTRWWRNHILLEDLKYKPFLSECTVEALS